MKTKKLVTMVDYILNIDWMTTTEFCNETGAPLPTVRGGVDSFLQIDAIKHRMFVEYAKFLNKELIYEMFEGEKRIFECGKYIDRQPSTSFNTYEVNGVVLFADSNTQRNVSRGLKVNDLTTLGILYNER
jgi:hypothetical protein